MLKTYRIKLGVAIILLSSPVFAQDLISSDYGFRAMEIFKLEKRSQNMVAGDLNHDGRRDLLLVDNSHSRLDLLLQRKEKPKEDDPIDTSDVNAIKYDWRFDHKKIPVDHEVTSLAVGDFNHDGKTDIAYFGSPDRLIIRTQTKEAEWPEMLNLRLADVPKNAWLIAAGDLNHDDRDDLVILGKEVTYLLYQQQDGTMGPPNRLMNTSSNLALAQIADIDGDGLNDLCYTADGDGERVFCLRIQTADGRLGPEMVFDLHKPRSVTLGDLDGKPGKEVFVVDSRTNRVNVLKLERPETKADQPLSRLIQYGFGESGTGRDREMATGDIDGDGRVDVVVTDPDAARLLVFRQHKRQGLDSGTTYPSLVGATQVRIAQFGKGPASVLLLSNRERTLAECKFEEGRLTFPSALPAAVYEPLVFEVHDLDGDKIPEVLYVSDDDKELDSKHFQLNALKWTEKGWIPYTWGTEKTVKIRLDNEPERLKKVDVNQDGRMDYLVFYGGGRKPSLLLTDEKGKPQPTEIHEGIQLGEVSRSSVFIKSAPSGKNPEKKQGAILAAQDSFARELKLDANNNWQVLDQYNASGSNARIAGVATLDMDGQPGEEVVLIDSGIEKIRILKREESLYRPWKEIDLGAFPIVSTHVADLNADGRDDLILFGRHKFGVVYTGQADPEFKRIASYETKRDKVYFADVAVGDLNGDQKTDLAVIDTREHFVEILTHNAEAGLKRALHFRVFEEKSFGRSTAGGIEPRETLIVDVTGDNRADLLLLIHDRILLYPQDDGE